MKTGLLFAGAAFAGLGGAQTLDFDVIDAAGPPATETVPLGVVAPSDAVYVAEEAMASVAAEITESPLPEATADIPMSEMPPATTPEAAAPDAGAASDTVTPGSGTGSSSPQTGGSVLSAISGLVSGLLGRAACDPEEAGMGPVASPDTASGFVSFAAFSDAASKAPTPAGYNSNFKGLQGSTEFNGKIMGWYTLDEYDSNVCAARCDKVQGCMAFNVYFERAPSVNPGSSCPNPSSTTVIKCILWGQAVSATMATNKGQWRSNFKVVIAGSNGYTKLDMPPVDEYLAPVSLGRAAIMAPMDCSGHNTYMGVKVFKDVPFDPSLCAAACSAQSEYNRAHPSKGGLVKTCQFFNTYMLLKNGVPQVQQCALYTMAWDSSLAKNTGQWRGSNRYTIDQSYIFTNATDAGSPWFPCE